jgi:hypothetical protein
LVEGVPNGIRAHYKSSQIPLKKRMTHFALGGLRPVFDFRQ